MFSKGHSIRMGGRILLQSLIAGAILLVSVTAAFGGDSLRSAYLGDFRLENGAVIQNCRLAYRTMGNPDSSGSNTVLVPTWLAGTTKDLIDLGILGPGKAVDSSRFYIVAVDSLGNGVSSSPSNSDVHPDRAFPQFSIRDMVRAQYILLTEHLKINNLRAVVGISMGGMQAWQWAASYPGFADRIVPIVGTPWLTSNDLLVMAAELAVIRDVSDCTDGRSAMKALAPLHTLLAWTPRYRATETRPDSFPEFLSGLEKAFLKFNAADWASQVRAIMGHDIRKNFGGYPDKTSDAIRSRVLIVTSGTDQIVYPEPSETMGRMLKAETAGLNGYCGHLAFLCDSEGLRRAVRSFLEKP